MLRNLQPPHLNPNIEPTVTLAPPCLSNSIPCTASLLTMGLCSVGQYVVNYSATSPSSGATSSGAIEVAVEQWMAAVFGFTFMPVSRCEAC